MIHIGVMTQQSWLFIVIVGFIVAIDTGNETDIMVGTGSGTAVEDGRLSPPGHLHHGFHVVNPSGSGYFDRAIRRV